MKYEHTPVLLDEAIKGLEIKKGGIYIDATLGGGSYTKKILELCSKLGGKFIVVSTDLDSNAILNFLDSLNKNYQKFFLKIKYFEREVIRIDYSEDITLYLVNDNFANIKDILNELKFAAPSLFENMNIQGIVADLGLSSFELDNLSGFSFRRLNDDLDMRLEKTSDVKASDLLNTLPGKELANVFSRFSDEKNAYQIARVIEYKRNDKKFETVEDLVNIIQKLFGNRGQKYIDDTLQRLFQALRIAVNSEFFNLEELIKFFSSIKNPSRLVIVSFHSGEDRVVKVLARNLKLKQINPDVITPTQSEIEKNSRSKSAKLRILKNE